MIYILESELLKKQSVQFGLTNIFGIGKLNAFFICKKLGFSKNLKVENLSKEQVNKLIKTVELLNLSLASELKKEKLFQLKQLLSIKSYKGLRRSQGLPARGQRTHTNARTSRKRK